MWWEGGGESERQRESVCAASLTDEVGLSGVDGVLQLVGGDAELVLGAPVDGDGVVGGGAQLVTDGRRVGRCSTRSNTRKQRPAL